jgi:hypothetical protein
MGFRPLNQASEQIQQPQLLTPTTLSTSEASQVCFLLYWATYLEYRETNNKSVEILEKFSSKKKKKPTTTTTKLKGKLACG